MPLVWIRAKEPLAPSPAAHLTWTHLLVPGNDWVPTMCVGAWARSDVYIVENPSMMSGCCTKCCELARSYIYSRWEIGMEL